MHALIRKKSQGWNVADSVVTSVFENNTLRNSLENLLNLILSICFFSSISAMLEDLVDQLLLNTIE